MCLVAALATSWCSLLAMRSKQSRNNVRVDFVRRLRAAIERVLISAAPPRSILGRVTEFVFVAGGVVGGVAGVCGEPGGKVCPKDVIGSILAGAKSESPPSMGFMFNFSRASFGVMIAVRT